MHRAAAGAAGASAAGSSADDSARTLLAEAEAVETRGGWWGGWWGGWSAAGARSPGARYRVYAAAEEGGSSGRSPKGP